MDASHLLGQGSLCPHAGSMGRKQSGYVSRQILCNKPPQHLVV